MNKSMKYPAKRIKSSYNFKDSDNIDECTIDDCERLEETAYSSVLNSYLDDDTDSSCVSRNLSVVKINAHNSVSDKLKTTCPNKEDISLNVVYKTYSTRLLTSEDTCVVVIEFEGVCSCACKTDDHHVQQRCIIKKLCDILSESNDSATIRHMHTFGTGPLKVEKSCQTDTNIINLDGKCETETNTENDGNSYLSKKNLSNCNAQCRTLSSSEKSSELQVSGDLQIKYRQLWENQFSSLPQWQQDIWSKHHVNRSHTCTSSDVLQSIVPPQPYQQSDRTSLVMSTKEQNHHQLKEINKSVVKSSFKESVNQLRNATLNTSLSPVCTSIERRNQSGTNSLRKTVTGSLLSNDLQERQLFPDLQIHTDIEQNIVNRSVCTHNRKTEVNRVTSKEEKKQIQEVNSAGISKNVSLYSEMNTEVDVTADTCTTTEKSLIKHVKSIGKFKFVEYQRPLNNTLTQHLPLLASAFFKSSRGKHLAHDKENNVEPKDTENLTSPHEDLSLGNISSKFLSKELRQWNIVSDDRDDRSPVKQVSANSESKPALWKSKSVIKSIDNKNLENVTNRPSEERKHLKKRTDTVTAKNKELTKRPEKKSNENTNREFITEIFSEGKKNHNKFKYKNESLIDKVSKSRNLSEKQLSDNWDLRDKTEIKTKENIKLKNSVKELLNVKAKSTCEGQSYKNRESWKETVEQQSEIRDSIHDIQIHANDATDSQNKTVKILKKCTELKNRTPQPEENRQLSSSVQVKLRRSKKNNEAMCTERESDNELRNKAEEVLEYNYKLRERINDVLHESRSRNENKSSRTKKLKKKTRGRPRKTWKSKNRTEEIMNNKKLLNDNKTLRKNTRYLLRTINTENMLNGTLTSQTKKQLNDNRKTMGKCETDRETENKSEIQKRKVLESDSKMMKNDDLNQALKLQSELQKKVGRPRKKKSQADSKQVQDLMKTSKKSPNSSENSNRKKLLRNETGSQVWRNECDQLSNKKVIQKNHVEAQLNGTIDLRTLGNKSEKEKIKSVHKSDAEKESPITNENQLSMGKKLVFEAEMESLEKRIFNTGGNTSSLSQVIQNGTNCDSAYHTGGSLNRASLESPDKNKFPAPPSVHSEISFHMLFKSKSRGVQTPQTPVPSESSFASIDTQRALAKLGLQDEDLAEKDNLPEQTLSTRSRKVVSDVSRSVNGKQLRNSPRVKYVDSSEEYESDSEISGDELWTPKENGHRHCRESHASSSANKERKSSSKHEAKRNVNRARKCKRILPWSDDDTDVSYISKVEWEEEIYDPDGPCKRHRMIYKTLVPKKKRDNLYF